ncbi:MAG: carbohydrate kinase [Gammaproteobacteria bacterium]|nr:carbohydrate kinase [Gammaproteobacteria bacterium]
MYLICGEALFDIFQLDDQDNTESVRLNAYAGGSPFNVAIGIARLGGQASLMTGISTDALGRKLISILERESVGLDYLLRSGRRTTLSLVNLDSEGSPEYAFYGQDSADTAIEPDQLPGLGAEIEGIHFGSYSLVVKPVADAFEALLKANSDRFISLDPNVRPTIEADMVAWRVRIERYSSYADLIKISREDIEYLYPGVNHQEKINEWLGRGVSLVVITDGGKGCAAWTGSGLHLKMPVLKSNVIDTVGAGDSFQAALLAKLGEAGNLKQAVRALDQSGLQSLIDYAIAAASITCSRRGADLPTKQVVQSSLDERLG